MTISFRTDSWDRYNAYTNIPVEILYDDQVIYTEYVNYSAYGGKQHSLTLNVGSKVGVHEITARINWANRTSEASSTNNATTTAELTVREKRDLAIEVVDPNSAYRAGVTVITSYVIHNNSRYDVTPDQENTVAFEGNRKRVAQTLRADVSGSSPEGCARVYAISASRIGAG